MDEVCVARGGAYGSSNQSAFMHRCVPLERVDGVYLDYVHSAGIIWGPESDRVTTPCVAIVGVLYYIGGDFILRLEIMLLVGMYRQTSSHNNT